MCSLPDIASQAALIRHDQTKTAQGTRNRPPPADYEPRQSNGKDIYEAGLTKDSSETREAGRQHQLAHLVTGARDRPPGRSDLRVQPKAPPSHPIGLSLTRRMPRCAGGVPTAQPPRAGSRMRKDIAAICSPPTKKAAPRVHSPRSWPALVSRLLIGLGLFVFLLHVHATVIGVAAL